MFKAMLLSSIAGLVLIVSIGLALVTSQPSTQSSNLKPVSFMLTESMISFDKNQQSLGQRNTELESNQGLPAAVFTYQGVLNDLGGSPVVGPVGLQFKVFGTAAEETELSTITHDMIMPDTQGRFQVEVPLPNAPFMANYTGYTLRIFETTGFTQIGDDIDMQPAPFAWVSEYARSASFASNAGASDFATNAQNAVDAETALTADLADQANSLVNDQTINLNLEFRFNIYGNGFAAPRATRIGNIVFLDGVVGVPSGAPSNSLMTILPEGMRPSGKIVLALEGSQSLSAGGNTPVRFDVSEDGRINNITFLLTNSWVSLNGAYFIVAD